MEAKIKEEVLKKVKEKTPEAFLEAHIQWHTRKHQVHYKTWCSCNFCVEKWAGTRYIGYTPFPFVKYQEEIGRRKGIPTHDLSLEDIAKDMIRRERERKRRSVRQRLRDCKEEII